MTVIAIERSKSGEVASRLRMLAKKIDEGKISYCVIYAMDLSGVVVETILDNVPTGSFGRSSSLR